MIGSGWKDCIGSKIFYECLSLLYVYHTRDEKERFEV